jgi:type VI protein secretion system component VasK
MLKISDGRLALGLAAAFAFWLFAVLPFLYGPPPRFAETSSPPQAHADQSDHQPAAKPDGSITAPFFMRIPKTAKEEAEDATDRREKSSTDRWLMIFTGAVALFTLLLVGATVMLYVAGEKQLRLASETSKRQSGEMQESIAVANRSAR